MVILFDDRLLVDNHYEIYISILQNSRKRYCQLSEHCISVYESW